MTDHLSEPRPRLYGALRSIAYVIGGLSVAFALYLLFVVGAEGGAYYLMFIPAITFGFAIRIWLFGRVVETTDRLRAEERKAGRKLTLTDVGIYIVGLVVIGSICLSRAPFQGSGQLSETLIFLFPVLIAAILGGQHLLKLKRGETEHTEFTAKNMFKPKLFFAIFGGIMLIYFAGVYGGL